MRRLVFDIDYLLDESVGKPCHSDLANLSGQLLAYRQIGFEIILTSSAGAADANATEDDCGGRRMAPAAFERIEELGLAFDYVMFGNPPLGRDGLFLDDKAITPEEFQAHDYAQITEMITTRECETEQ